MAAIPLALSLSSEVIPVLVPLIKSLITHVGTHVTSTSTLQQTVTDAVAPIVKTLSSGGVLPNGVDPAVLSGVIQTLIHEMGPTATPATPAPMNDTIAGEEPSSPTDVEVVPAGTATTPTGSTLALPPGSKFTFTGTITLQ